MQRGRALLTRVRGEPLPQPLLAFVALPRGEKFSGGITVLGVPFSLPCVGIGRREPFSFVCFDVVLRYALATGRVSVYKEEADLGGQNGNPGL